MGRLFCATCGGEGSLYGSRYGGNDPDVYRTGKCDVCNGSGDEPCAARGCEQPAVAFNDEGEALCEDCLAEWVSQYSDDTEDHL